MILEQQGLEFPFGLLLHDILELEVGVVLPDLLQLDNLLEVQVPHFPEHGLAGLLGHPVDELLFLDEGVPAAGVPLQVVVFFVLDTWRSAQEQHCGVLPVLDVDEPQYEDVGVPADVALDGHISEFAFGMDADFVVLGLDEVDDDVGGHSSSIALGVAEPLPAVLGSALHHAIDVVDTAVAARVGR